MAAPGQTLTCLFLHLLAVTTVMSSSYVTYIPGTLPVILSSPHGGSLQPSTIPVRRNGCYNATADSCTFAHGCGEPSNIKKCRVVITKDLGTKELTFLVSDELFNLTGHRPHVIINELHRTRLDANRDIYQAAQGVYEAELAWMEYHGHINTSKKAVGRGLLLDMHGQTHPERWIELGYLMLTNDLNKGGASLVESASSIRSLSEDSPLTFEALLRGPTSFGAYLDTNGADAAIVPSNSITSPGSGRFYAGGYITKNHGSRDGGKIDAIQIESPLHLRNVRANRPTYARAIAFAVRDYLSEHYGALRTEGISNGLNALK